jgi:hypothetical protein
MDVEKTTELIKALAEQQRLALQACYSILMKSKMKASIGLAYEVYKDLCQNQATRSPDKVIKVLLCLPSGNRILN